mmetsp:Transcript_20631/g.26327  ORF Transcript_20631/g.26327 Transcript_20631/m.26327 type:complete len:221 (-) Transcript_20631:141-803(-)
MSKKILSLLLGLRIQGGASSFVIKSSSSAAITERTSACSYSYYKHSNSQIANNNSNLNFQSSRALFGTSSSDDTTNNHSNNSNMSDEVAAAKAAAAEYKSSDADGAGPETAFDNILSGKWPSAKVYEDSTVLAFRDINPQAPTHIIVIPKHRDGLTKLSNAREDQEGILGHLLFVAQSVGRKECPEGFRVVVNDGEQGAQSVYHLHLHVLGGRQMGWPPG